ncbi:MAG: hypothetical protein J5U17_11610 [Candidatus Methanoperedens sp.]|nr:hypothetical protein [Candidatus Methanoperedens sp.]MCE8426409.1 hypothetical protein [Candidatus Methanoperedens sp.]MCE8429374.1 hypothetical protein [Candidatus Methanoperedens sp.]
MPSKIDLDTDLTKAPYIYYIIFIYSLSRIPFLDLGFSAFTVSTDSDVLAIVNSAYLLRYYHIYTVSRFPGFPFYEFFNSFLIGGGWLFTNMGTAIVSFIGWIIFGKVLTILQIKNKALLFITFGFLPIIWINSTITIDYMWALMFVLLACFFVFSERYGLGGLALGFAVGTRFTSVFMIIPLLYWMIIGKIDVRKMKHFILIGFFTSLGMFLPVLYKYHSEFLKGSGFISTTPLNKPLETFAGSVLISSMNLISDLTGILVIILVLILFLLRKVSFSDRRDLSKFCWITMLIYGILYFIFPYKTAYLIPAVPWILIIMNEKLGRKYFAIVCILLLLNNIITINIIKEDIPDISIDSGLILKNYQERRFHSIKESQEYLDSLSKILSEERNSRNIS